MVIEARASRVLGRSGLRARGLAALGGIIGGSVGASVIRIGVWAPLCYSENRERPEEDYGYQYGLLHPSGWDGLQVEGLTIPSWSFTEVGRKVSCPPQLTYVSYCRPW